MASFAAARAFGAAGRGLGAIGSLIARQREDADQKRAREDELNYRRQQDQMSTDIRLAELGGGRGAAPMMEIPNVAAGMGPGALTQAPVRAPDPRYVKVGEDAYVMTRGAREQQEQNARVGALKQEWSAKRDWELQDEQRRIDAIARIAARQGIKDPQGYAEGVVYGVTDPTPTPERFGTGVFQTPDGKVVQVGDRGSVRAHDVAIAGRPGTVGSGRGGSSGSSVTAQRASAARSKQSREQAISYVSGLIRQGYGKQTNPDGTQDDKLNTAWLRDQLTTQGWSDTEAVGIVGDALKEAQSGSYAISTTDADYPGRPGSRPQRAAPVAAPAAAAAQPAAAAPAPAARVGPALSPQVPDSSMRVDPVQSLRQQAQDTINRWRQEGVSPDEIIRRAREKGW